MHAPPALAPAGAGPVEGERKAGSWEETKAGMVPKVCGL